MRKFTRSLSTELLVRDGMALKLSTTPPSLGAAEHGLGEKLLQSRSTPPGFSLWRLGEMYLEDVDYTEK